MDFSIGLQINIGGYSYTHCSHQSDRGFFFRKSPLLWKQLISPLTTKMHVRTDTHMDTHSR